MFLFDSLPVKLAGVALGYWCGSRNAYTKDYSSSNNFLENNDIKSANVMLIGRTGVGKSSLINYLLDRDACVTGFGKPVTQDFKEYHYEDDNGFKINFFDSKGLEVEDFINSKENIINFVKQRCNSNDFSKWLHTIFYCINITRYRLEKDEIEFIQSLSNSIAQKIHIVITHCNDGNKNNVDNMVERIKSEIGEDIEIYCVNSVNEETRRGSIQRFGRVEVLNGIFKILWCDVACKISMQYAPAYCEALEYIIKVSRKKFLNLLDEYSTFEILKRFINDDLGDVDKSFDKVIDEISNIYEQYQKSLYERHLAIAVNFMNNYHKVFSNSSENIFNITDFQILNIDCLDNIDDLVDKSKLGKLMNEIENIDDDNVLDVLFAIGKGSYYALRIKSLIEEIINKVCGEMMRNIPTVEQMQKEIETILLEPVNK